MLVFKLVVLLLSILLILCGLLYFWQDKLLFFPRVPVGYEVPLKNPEGLRHPGEYRIPYQDLEIESTDGVKIHAWFMRQPASASCPTLLFFQGNAGNMGFRLPNLVDLYRALKVNIIAPSYRGYGSSTGIPTEKGLKDDVVAVLEYIESHEAQLNINSQRLYLFGRSLGGAVAIYLAHGYPSRFRGLILENTFLSIKEMAKRILPPLASMPWLLNLLARLEFNSNDLIRTLPMPVLFLSGEEDTLVPPYHMDELFELATKAAFRWMVKVADGTHNDTWQTCPEEYYPTIKRFIKRAEEEDTHEATQKIRLNCECKNAAAAETCIKARGPRFYEVMTRHVAPYQP